MRQVSVEINGVSYPLCYSVRVVKAAVERYGSLEAMSAAIFGEDGTQSLDERLWLLSQEMAAGAIYASMNGIDAPKPLSVDDILDSVHGMQLGELLTAAINAVAAGSETSIEAEPPKGKNAEATPES